MKPFLLAAVLALSGCGVLAEFGVIDESYKGSFIRGDAYEDLCTNVFEGEWAWKPGTEPSCSRGPVDLLTDKLD